MDMTALPKLRIRVPSENTAPEICSLEQAQYRFNWQIEPFLISVEGQFIKSFEDLLDLAKQDLFKDREFLEVELVPWLDGG